VKSGGRPTVRLWALKRDGRGRQQGVSHAGALVSVAAIGVMVGACPRRL